MRGLTSSEARSKLRRQCYGVREIRKGRRRDFLGDAKPCLAPLPEPLLRFAVAVAPALQAEAAPPRSLAPFLSSGSADAAPRPGFVRVDAGGTRRQLR